MNAYTRIPPRAVLADSEARATAWHQTRAARAAISAVVLAGEQATEHRKAYAQTTDEWYTYEGPLAAKVVALWTLDFERADAAYRAGDTDALKRWCNAPRPDDVIDAAFARRAVRS